MPDAKTEEKAISFVTRKALVTFGPHNPIAIVQNGSAFFTQTAIIEYQEAEGMRYDRIPGEFTIIGLTDGKKLTKRIHAVSRMGVPYALVELDEEDVAALCR